ncbi:MAG TPA: HAMP domain-containing histidine kinase [Candidatus Mediterraneibacter stercorigallinarum]|uniref:histidine kinase n=1 Tax=Candidatus Mediterraneibacter stercorigallinarum TaxID=2838686 RepID=A0A9D2IKK1_9FIRM|nr:HAMP domain-containing histidine kinase [Candidatus Mediterraneibacter stercorigallinarum]
MVFWLCCLISIVIIIIAILVIKIHLLRKSADEISDAFSDRVASDTNILIDLSSRDRHMQNLADNMNRELKKLQSDRHRYQQGDTELKNAVTNISHDLRTPLTAICGYLDMLDKEDQNENTKRYLKIIRGRTEIMKQLTEELFRYSVFTSVSNGTPSEPVILNSILEESISALYTSLRQSRITPSIVMPDVKVSRMLNRNAVSRIFGNIISNAVKYSDGDLEIILEETGRITFANHAEKLDEIQVGRLFDRFYTVETASSGSTGLGLSIARALTEQMGGSITAEYKDGMILVHVHFP